MVDFPAMPFWFERYWADTHHLSLEQHGAYFLLINLLWRAPRRCIPNDSRWIADRMHIGVDRVESLVRPLIREFCQSDGNWITQKKVIAEYNFVERRRTKRSDAAKSRWQKEKDLYNASTTHTHTHTHKDKKESGTLNGGVGSGAARKGKPRHGQKTKDGKRIWLDRDTDEFKAYAADYLEKHHYPVTLQWNNSGAWFNIAGEHANQTRRDHP